VFAAVKGGEAPGRHARRKKRDNTLAHPLLTKHSAQRFRLSNLRGSEEKEKKRPGGLPAGTATAKKTPSQSHTRGGKPGGGGGPKKKKKKERGEWTKKPITF